MTEYVALLRGINVGKAKRIAMADLRGLLEALGHSNVRTLLNSGNAVFEAPSRGSAPGIASAIERKIADRLGLQVPVIVLKASELNRVVEENPLLQASSDPPRFLVAFLRDKKALAAAEALTSGSWAPDAYAVGTRAAYLWCASGIIESRLIQAFARATGDAATARNWATVLKLQAMLR